MAGQDFDSKETNHPLGLFSVTGSGLFSLQGHPENGFVLSRRIASGLLRLVWYKSDATAGVSISILPDSHEERIASGLL